MKPKSNRNWPWFFLAAAFESLVAIIVLLFVPSENGLSLARLALAGILLLFFVGGIYFGIRARRGSMQFDPFARTRVIISAALLSVTSSLSLFLLRYLDPEKLLPYYERLSPVLWYFVLFGVQAVIFLLLIKNGFHLKGLSKRKPIYYSALYAFCILMGMSIFIAVTKIGITPDTGYWGEPGVVVQGWQMMLSILFGVLILLLGLWKPIAESPLFHWLILPVVIYATACILWLGVPTSVLENSFYAPITPPANMPFPSSDAGFYDYLAQSLLIGTDYLGGIPPRPLYVLFLAILHYCFGQNYPAIITAQTFLLASFPVALYFLGKKIHSPAAGVMAALFSIFRELVGLWISSNTRVANSKIFTTDFPTALGIVCICLVVIWWLERRDLKSTLLAGGAFGLLLLLRTQSLFTLPLVILLAWFVYRRKTREWLLAAAVFVFAMLFTVSPWLTHNYLLTGKFTFDDPNQVGIIYSQYSFSGNLDTSQYDPDQDSVGNRILSFTLENPGYVATFIATHFLNTEIGGLLALPLIKPFDGLFAPVNLYWVGWDGSLEWYNLLLIVVYLAVLAVGLGTAWRRLGWIGLIPLVFNLGYALANGISRFSSWRYNLPVDWVIYFYIAVGMIEIIKGIAITFGAKFRAGDKSANSKEFSLRDYNHGYILFLLLFALVGSSPWRAEGITKPRYTSTQEQLFVKLETSGISPGELRAFIAQPDAVMLEGQMLYPRMYRRDLGMASTNPWPAYAIREYARIGFILLNESQTQAIYITRDLLDFPQGADAIMLGCQREGFVETRLIDFGDHFYQAAPLTDPCE